MVIFDLLLCKLIGLSFSLLGLCLISTIGLSEEKIYMRACGKNIDKINKLSEIVPRRN
jgi:hypothetical protein